MNKKKTPRHLKNSKLCDRKEIEELRRQLTLCQTSRDHLLAQVNNLTKELSRMQELFGARKRVALLLFQVRELSLVSDDKLLDLLRKVGGG